MGEEEEEAGERGGGDAERSEMQGILRGERDGEYPEEARGLSGWDLIVLLWKERKD